MDLSASILDIFQRMRIDPARGALGTFEDLAVDAALEEFDGDVRAAAEYLGISHQSVYRNLGRRGLRAVKRNSALTN